MSFPYYDLVVRAHSELINEGKIKQRSNQEEVEQDKGLLTRRAGFYVNDSRDSTIGLLRKTEGNNSQGFSVDLLIRLDGVFWDVATDKDGMAQPLDGGPSGPDIELAQKWVQPTAELAQITTGDDDSWNNKDFEDSKAVEFGTVCNETYNECGAPIDPGMISVHSQRTAYDYYVMGMGWSACLQKHTNEFRAEYGLPPI
jgi:hypothetical protein